MALAFQIQQAGLTARELSTEAAVTLAQEAQGFRITRSVLTLMADVPGINKAKFDELARQAEKTCPVSTVLNAEISLNATLK